MKINFFWKVKVQSQSHHVAVAIFIFWQHVKKGRKIRPQSSRSSAFFNTIFNKMNLNMIDHSLCIVNKGWAHLKNKQLDWNFIGEFWNWFERGVKSFWREAVKAFLSCREAWIRELFGVKTWSDGKTWTWKAKMAVTWSVKPNFWSTWVVKSGPKRPRERPFLNYVIRETRL